ncbi:MAG: ribosome maturation factor RimP [Holosporales bacterium]|jgi:ribosome maturation factor RimP|nr:ribosome maturation factor RimP [Holosporales bacterium]
MESLLAKIEYEISFLVEALGCKIVRVAFLNASGNRKTLQVMIEREDNTPVSIEDCNNVSRAVSLKLDVIDLIPDHYVLEVSSTGIDRPLVKPEDYCRFCGEYVVIKTCKPINGQKIFKGILESASKDGIKLGLQAPDGNGGFVELSYEEIRGAHIDGFRK